MAFRHHCKATRSPRDALAARRDTNAARRGTHVARRSTLAAAWESETISPPPPTPRVNPPSLSRGNIPNFPGRKGEGGRGEGRRLSSTLSICFNHYAAKTEALKIEQNYMQWKKVYIFKVAGKKKILAEMSAKVRTRMPHFYLQISHSKKLYLCFSSKFGFKKDLKKQTYPYFVSLFQLY